MRVITGSARGRKLITLEGEEITRPTSQSTKEALFSSIQFELEGKRVLDLFAGCGQLGIEALSRGAVFCTFVENNRQAYKITEQNIKTCEMGDMSSLVFSDAVSFLNRKGIYDIAFLDPPYNKGLIDECLGLLSEHMSDEGVIICETARNEVLPQNAGDFVITRERNYGKTKLTYYRKETEE
jgi:16S rRNA (guanine(966)-N(2))-methyltransferase RsmD